MFVFVSCPVMWRVWEERDESASAAEPALIPFPFTKTLMEFTVMSYNILAEDLLKANQELYTHCPQEVLDWSYRCILVVEEILKWAPDVSHFFLKLATFYILTEESSKGVACVLCVDYVSPRGAGKPLL